MIGHVDKKFNNFKHASELHEAEYWKLTLTSHFTNKENYFLNGIAKFYCTICTDQIGKFACS